MSTRRLLALTALVAALVGASAAPASAQAPPDPVDLPPDAAVLHPGPGAIVPIAPLAASGVAVDDVGVAEVRIAIQDATTRLWWRADGTWGAWQQHQATLDTPGAPTTTWTHHWTPPAGGAYNLQVEARDGTGQRDPTRAFQRFVAAAPPDTAVTVPAPAQSFPPAPIRLAGTAVDDIGVAEVRIAIQDATTRLWWRADGTWGAWQQHQATLDTPGAATTTWTHDWTPPVEGAFNLQVEARDGTGLRDPSRSWLRFSVATPDPAYLSIVIGRSHWAVTDGSCEVLPGAVTLDRVAEELAGRGLAATGGVVPPKVAESSRTCQGLAHYASWDDLASLRDGYGWSFFPRADTALATLSPSQQWDRSCGLLPVLEAHGHDRGWGLFAYQNNDWSSAVQEAVVSSCFAYGRQYGWGRNREAEMGQPWFQSTRSFNGGRCNDASLPCATAPIANGRRYDDPALIAAAFQPGAGGWNVAQFYFFVEGSYSDPDDHYNSWDCTSSDWRAHWTSRAELYCFDDFVAALDQLPGDVIVTDPAAVAEAWGRTPPSRSPQP